MKIEQKGRREKNKKKKQTPNHNTFLSLSLTHNRTDGQTGNKTTEKKNMFKQAHGISMQNDIVKMKRKM